MIIFSEIGDKTFLIAALMAMKHDRLLVFSAAFSALIAMTILSAVLGHAVPTLLPKRFTSFLAAVLFLVFGARMLKEGYGISPNEGVSSEMKEVEMELEEKEEQARKMGRRRSSVTPYMLESGRLGSRKSRSSTRLPAPPASPPSSPDSRSPSPGRGSGFSKALAGINNLFSLLLSPAWVQTFVMTFLGEWGDRSQIATIAMAAGQDYWWVTGGAVSGHALCTAAAVVGGRAIAGRVSLRVGEYFSYTDVCSGRFDALTASTHSDTRWRLRICSFWTNLSRRSYVLRIDFFQLLNTFVLCIRGESSDISLFVIRVIRLGGCDRLWGLAEVFESIAQALGEGG